MITKKVVVAGIAILAVGGGIFIAASPKPWYSSRSIATTHEMNVKSVNAGKNRLWVDLSAGQKIVCNSVLNMDIDMTQMNMPVKMQMNMNGASTMEILSATPDGYIPVRTTLDAVTGNMTMNGTVIDLNSDMGKNIPQMQMIGKASTVLLNKSGQSVSIEGMSGDDFLKALSELSGSSMSVLTGVPDEPVAVGDTWKDSIAVEGWEQFQTTVVSTLDRIEEIDGAKVAVIKRKCVQSLTAPATLPPLNAENGQKVDATIETMMSESELDIYLLLETGHLLSCDMKMAQDLTMTIKVPTGTKAGTITMPMTQKGSGTGTISFTYQ